jgi:hypothetical protein
MRNRLVGTATAVALLVVASGDAQATGGGPLPPQNYSPDKNAQILREYNKVFPTPPRPGPNKGLYQWQDYARRNNLPVPPPPSVYQQGRPAIAPQPGGAAVNLSPFGAVVPNNAPLVNTGRTPPVTGAVQSGGQIILK